MDDDAGAVIAGLLHPDPSHRYNVTDLLNQPYFHDIQGTSYFVDIEKKACARPSIPLHHDFDEYYHEALVPPELFQPQWESTDQGQRTGQYPFEYFGWVHPQGLWSHAQSPFHTDG